MGSEVNRGSWRTLLGNASRLRDDLGENFDWQTTPELGLLGRECRGR